MKRIFSGIARFFRHPNFTCDICGREVFGGERICEKCFALLPWNREQVCPICGRRQVEAGICLECKAERPFFERARSVFTHEGEGKKLVLRFKNGEKFLSETLSELLFPLLREFPEADAVTCVPMTVCSERTRGYNQSELLAEAISRKSGLEFLPIIGKIRDTNAQKTLTRAERQKNLHGCFKVKDKKAVSGRVFLLIDDTMTTGATANEIVACLKAAGAQKVFLLTVTSVEYKSSFV